MPNFVPTKLEEDREKGDITFTIKLNTKEQKWLYEDMNTMNEKKRGTAIKNLAKVGSKVLRDQKMGAFIRILFKNKKNNKRSGIIDFED